LAEGSNNAQLDIGGTVAEKSELLCDGARWASKAYPNRTHWLCFGATIGAGHARSA
jgi:hypothetical protein